MKLVLEIVTAVHIGDAKMSDANRLLFLRIALIIIGLTFIFGIYTLGVIWPSGWAWGQGHSHYLMMIIGVYATLGVFCAHRLQKSLRSQEHHLVHRMVKRDSRGDHGRSGPHRYVRARSFGGRCACAHSRCHHTCSVDTARTAQG